LQAVNERACSGLFLARLNSKLLQKRSWRTAFKINLSSEHKPQPFSGSGLARAESVGVWSGLEALGSPASPGHPQLSLCSAEVLAFLPSAVADALPKRCGLLSGVWFGATGTSPRRRGPAVWCGSRRGCWGHLGCDGGCCDRPPVCSLRSPLGPAQDGSCQMLNQDHNLPTRGSAQAGLLAQHPAQPGPPRWQEHTGNVPKASRCGAGTTPLNVRHSQGTAAEPPRAILAQQPQIQRVQPMSTRCCFPRCGPASSPHREAGLLPWPEPAPEAAGLMSPH